MKNGLLIALQNIRENLSENNKKLFPEIYDGIDVSKVAEPVLSNPNLYNEFCNVLLQKIVYTQVEKKIFKNKLQELEGDEMPLGYLGEEIFINPAIGRDFDIDDFEGALKKYEADVKVQYQGINFDKQYPVTISREKLKQAFTTWPNFESFVNGLTRSLYNGLYIDKYNTTKGLVAQAYNSNAVQIHVVNALTDKNKIEDFLEIARTYFLNFQDPSSDYNAWEKIGGYGRAVETFTDESDVVMIIRNDILSKIDVKALASAFNIDKEKLMGKIYSVNNFDIIDRKTNTKILDGSKIYAQICDKKWFRIKPQDQYMDDFRNANNRTMNAYLNSIGMYKYSYFANAVCFATELPSVAITKLNFPNDSISVNVNEDKTIAVIPTPLNATSPATISYTSSNNSVATVQADSENPFACVVTGVTAGTVTITATAGNVSTTMTLTVKAVPLTSMTFEKQSTTIVANETEDVSIIPTPSNATPTTISYISSDESVATVEADDTDTFKCTITGVSAGIVTISAIAGNVSTTMVVSITSAT